MENWLEDTGENSAAEWLGEILSDTESMDYEMVPHERAVSFTGPGRYDAGYAGSIPSASDPDVTQAVSAIVNMIPAIVQAVAREAVLGEAEDINETTDQLVEMFWEAKPAEQSDEFWGAIVSALASIIPTVIPAIRNLVQSKRRRRRQTRRAPQQRRGVARREFYEDDDEGYFDLDERLDDEGVGAAISAIAPIALQALPAIMPLITQLLATSIPMIAKVAQGAAAPNPTPTAQPVAAAPVASTAVRHAATATTAQVPTRARETYADDDGPYEFVSSDGEESSYEGDPIFL